MKKFFLLSFGLIFLSACGHFMLPKTRFETNYNAMIGMSETQLVQTLGIPQRTYQTNDLKLLLYSEQKTYITPQTLTTSFDNTSYYGQATTKTAGGYVVNSFCNITFSLQNGYVVNWKYQGNACY